MHNQETVIFTTIYTANRHSPQEIQTKITYCTGKLDSVSPIQSHIEAPGF